MFIYIYLLLQSDLTCSVSSLFVISVVVPHFTASPGPSVTGSLGGYGPLPCPASRPPPQVHEPIPSSASQPLSPRLPHQGPGDQRDGEAERSPPDELIYGASFPSRQSGGPQVARSEDTGDGRCLSPDGPRLPVRCDAGYQTATPEWLPSVIRQPGIGLKEWQHGEQEQ